MELGVLQRRKRCRRGEIKKITSRDVYIVG